MQRSTKELEQQCFGLMQNQSCHALMSEPVTVILAFVKKTM